MALLFACGEAPEGLAVALCAEAPPMLLEHQPAPVLLINAYYLQEEAARDVRAGLAESPHLEETLAKASALGAGAVRTWAFNDGELKVGESAIQLSPGEYDEVALRGLDLVLARAQAYGLKLVLPLGNHWDDYGGARRYVSWAGLPEPIEGDPRFYTEPEVIELFRRHLTTLLSRVSTVDGFRYGEHPAVLAWELLNEPTLPRALDPDGSRLASWVDSMARHLETLAPGHQLGTGEQGFEVLAAEEEAGFWSTLPSPLHHEGSFRSNTASPWIDYGSIHLYPELWGIPDEHLAEAGTRWIAEHAAVARELGKPLLVSEFGLRNAGGLPLAERRETYRTWLECARRVGAAAFGPWLFAYDARPDEWDDHTFYFRDGTLPSDPVNRYADLLVEATRPRPKTTARARGGRPVTNAPRVSALRP